MVNLKKRTIAFIDSGIGGLPYLFWVRERLSQADYVYAADTVHFPYGQKSEDAVRSAVANLSGALIERYNPAVIVIACNTASVVSLAFLRKTFSVPFVGVVPAVKPAAERTSRRSIGILATNRTVQDHYTAALIDQFAGDCRVVPRASPELVDFVEKRWIKSGADEAEGMIRRICAPFIEEKIDVIVLGCTHFVFLKDVFQRVLGPEILVIDSVEGVGKQVMRICGDDEPKEAAGKGIFLTTGGDTSLQEEFILSRGIDLVIGGELR